MNSTATPRSPEPPECDATFERLPWLVNGTLPSLEAFAVESHVARCPRCASRLARERELLRAIRRPTSRVERSPLAAWAQFERALAAAPRAQAMSTSAGAGAVAGEEADADAVGVPVVAALVQPLAMPPAPAVGGGSASRLARWRGLRLALALQAAAIVVLAVALAWTLVARDGGTPDGSWRTVAAGDPSLARPGARWRVALDPALTSDQAVAILTGHGLRMLGSAVADAVYTVEPLGDATVDIEALRSDPRIRLAEPIVVPASVAAGRAAP